MRTFLLTLSEESDPRNPKHSLLAGPTHDYPTLRNAFHAKVSDKEFSVVCLWDSSGGIIRKKRLSKEVARESVKEAVRSVKEAVKEASKASKASPATITASEVTE